ncbi:MAG TPA: glycosyltransferase, partial [Acidimicrobiia bacterium]|nr:glycosyltransferase [Acidimicrobiia bacterium]
MLEQVLGHAVHGRNIQRALDDETDISPTVIPVGQRRAGLASRLPLLGSWSFEASMATRTALRRRLSAGHADAVFIHTQVATLLAGDLMRRVPTVISLDATPVNFDSLGAGYGHGRQPEAVERWKHRVNRRAFSASEAIVTFSRWAADSVVDDYGIPAAKVQVIRPGVDLRRLRPRPAGRPPGPARILFVGGDFVRKGGDDLLEAVRYLGDSAELDLVTASAPPSPPGSPRIRVHMGLDHSSEQLFDLYR